MDNGTPSWPYVISEIHIVAGTTGFAFFCGCENWRWERTLGRSLNVKCQISRPKKTKTANICPLRLGATLTIDLRNWYDLD